MQSFFYFPVLVFHGAFRWIVLLCAFLAIGASLRGWLRGTPWTRMDQVLSSVFVGAMDLQLTVGFLLYFGLSPLTRGHSNAPEATFFNIHMGVMLVAVILAHVGKISAAQVDGALLKHRRSALLFTFSLLLMLAAIPWWRPLIR